ncbi:MAG TPA: DUF192 domain-containing protein [Stellaceae bacterium]|jgi:hypothetical protein
MSMLRRSLLVVLVASGLTYMAHAQQLQTFEKAEITIDTAAGSRRFSVELAVTPAQEEQGLMFRQRLAPDAGMLFVFGDTAVRTFWMKNTLIPLDMLFIAPDGRIVDIHERAVPLSEDVIPSREPARAVLELNGGTAARLSIKIGDVVRYKSFGNAR